MRENLGRARWEWALSTQEGRGASPAAFFVTGCQLEQGQDQPHYGACKGRVSAVDDRQHSWPHAVEIVECDPRRDEKQPNTQSGKKPCAESFNPGETEYVTHHARDNQLAEKRDGKNRRSLTPFGFSLRVTFNARGCHPWIGQARHNRLRLKQMPQVSLQVH